MSNIYDMDEMIAELKAKQKDNEVIVFAIGGGRLMPFGLSRKVQKAMKEALEYIKKLDGFIGINPIDIWHNMLIFDTLNNAKSARNKLTAKGVTLGEIIPILIDDKWR